MKYIPNVFTFLNLSLGLSAILLLIQSQHPQKLFFVTACILLGGAADFFDGYFSRRLNANTELGKQLDSFADITTFGIAPLAFINYLSPREYSFLLALSSLVFLLAGAYRLARYNLAAFEKHFIGIPITIAGMILALYNALHPHWATQFPAGACLAITIPLLLGLSILMVSRKRFKRIM